MALWNGAELRAAPMADCTTSSGDGSAMCPCRLPGRADSDQPAQPARPGASLGCSWSHAGRWQGGCGAGWEAGGGGVMDEERGHGAGRACSFPGDDGSASSIYSGVVGIFWMGGEGIAFFTATAACALGLSGFWIVQRFLTAGCPRCEGLGAIFVLASVHLNEFRSGGSWTGKKLKVSS